MKRSPLKRRSALRAKGPSSKDRQWALDVKLRDRWCRRCGSSDRLHAHHIVSRRFLPLRHDLDNGVTLCWICHSWVHENPVTATSEGYLAGIPHESENYASLSKP